MQDLYGAKEDIKSDDKLLVNNSKKIEEYYHQRFNVDFTLNDIEEFARDTILQSNSLKLELDYLLDSKIDPVSKSAAIHIRNTDYLTSTYNWFDRQKYIVDAIAWMHKDYGEIDQLVVISDDIDLSKNQFDSIFSKQFKTTIYLEPDKDDSIQSSTLKDFLRLTLFRHKILFNSSFSTFSAYVGNVLYPGSFNYVYAPAFDIHKKFSDRNNYLWNLVPQQPK